MGTGTFALLLAAVLAPAADPSDVVYVKDRGFKLPIVVQDATRLSLREFQLFSSTDKGLTWNQVQAMPPDARAFIFRAPADGVYCFKIGVVDVQNRREPADIYASPVTAKVVVDTAKPIVHIIAAERQGDGIDVSWEMQEDHPDFNSLRLEYHTADSPDWEWHAIPVTSTSLKDHIHFRLADQVGITLRLTFADQAGNVTVEKKDIAGMPGSSLPRPTASQQPIVPPEWDLRSSNQMTTRTAPVETGSNPASGSITVSMPPTNPPVAVKNLPANWDPPIAPVETASLRNQTERTVSERNWEAPVRQPSRPTPVETASGYMSAPGYNREGSAPGGTRWPVSTVPLEMTNSPQIALNYQVTKVGPSGLGKVELYITQDEGHTWQFYQDDPNLKSPMTVSLPGEGIFGLRLVVTSGAGLGRRPPLPGDPPEMRVQVDSTPPVVKLHAPQPDTVRRDALVLTWTVSDANLTANPITLQYTERPDGQWKTIGADLPNSGRYVWTLPAGIPCRVYLRLTARDTAGNLGGDETQDAVLIDLHEPEGRILGLASSTRREASRQ